MPRAEDHAPKSRPKLSRWTYQEELKRLQCQLVRLQYRVKKRGQRIVVVIFEGRDAAGKGSTIKRIVDPLNPRGVRLVALQKPSDVERTQWYNRAGVEHIMASARTTSTGIS